MWRKIAFIIIITSVIFSISDYFYTKKDSYNRYLDGEYCFRYKVTTTPVVNRDSWYQSTENSNTASSVDLSDPKNMLLYGGTFDVYAYGPHDGVCTVIYGDKTVENFPVSNLKFSGDDADYFNGKKKLTYEEYIDRVGKRSSDQQESTMIPGNEMASFKGVMRNMYFLIGIEVFLCGVLFILYRNECKVAFDVLLGLGTLFAIAFEIGSALYY